MHRYWPLVNVGAMVLASDPCTRHLDEHDVKITGNNCPNITISHKNNRKLGGITGRFSKILKKTSSCLFLTKSLVGAHINSGNCEINTRCSPCTMMVFVFQTLRCRIWILVVEIPAAFCTIIIFQIQIFPFKSCFRKKNIQIKYIRALVKTSTQIISYMH